MKKIKYLTFVVLLFNCTAIRQGISENIISNTACKENDMSNGMIYFDATIDNQIQTFLFDTGASMSVILDSTAVSDVKKKKLAVFGSVSGADKKSVKKTTLIAKINSELFKSENKVFAYVDKPLTKCQQANKFKGILGIDAFFNNDNPLMLDFTNNKICNLSLQNKMDLIINEGFYEIKSQCKSNQIYVFLKVDGIEYKFLLDTGFKGTFVIPYSDKLNFSKFNSLIFEGSLFRTINSITDGKEAYYEDVPTIIGNETINAKILISTSLGHQNIGMGFIKAFDWIIDYNSNKIFIKKNKNDVESKINKNVFSYLASEKTNKLVVYSKQKQLTKYNLGDQITSVNNHQVTTENICEMQNLLNNTQDWNALNLEVIPVKK